MAAKFVVPVALSVRLASSSGVKSSSLTVNPTLALSVVELAFKSKVCYVHLTNCPRIK